LLTKLVSLKGDIQINEATNSLVVTDFPVNIKKIEDLLKNIDLPPIQVLIEARIIDIHIKAYENFGTTYTLNFNQTASFESFASLLLWPDHQAPYREDNLVLRQRSKTFQPRQP